MLLQELKRTVVTVLYFRIIWLIIQFFIIVNASLVSESEIGDITLFAIILPSIFQIIALNGVKKEKLGKVFFCMILLATSLFHSNLRSISPHLLQATRVCSSRLFSKNQSSLCFSYTWLFVVDFFYFMSSVVLLFLLSGYFLKLENKKAKRMRTLISLQQVRGARPQAEAQYQQLQVSGPTCRTVNELKPDETNLTPGRIIYQDRETPVDHLDVSVDGLVRQLQGVPVSPPVYSTPNV